MLGSQYECFLLLFMNPKKILEIKIEHLNRIQDLNIESLSCWDAVIDQSQRDNLIVKFNLKK